MFIMKQVSTTEKTNIYLQVLDPLMIIYWIFISKLISLYLHFLILYDEENYLQFSATGFCEHILKICVNAFSKLQSTETIQQICIYDIFVLLSLSFGP